MAANTVRHHYMLNHKNPDNHAEGGVSINKVTRKLHEIFEGDAAKHDHFTQMNGSKPPILLRINQGDPQRAIRDSRAHMEAMKPKSAVDIEFDPRDEVGKPLNEGMKGVETPDELVAAELAKVMQPVNPPSESAPPPPAPIADAGDSGEAEFEATVQAIAESADGAQASLQPSTSSVEDDASSTDEGAPQAQSPNTSRGQSQGKHKNRR